MKLSARVVCTTFSPATQLKNAMQISPIGRRRHPHDRGTKESKVTFSPVCNFQTETKTAADLWCGNFEKVRKEQSGKWHPDAVPESS